MLGDGGHTDAAPAQHRLESDGVLALAGEAGELPHEDLIEGASGPIAPSSYTLEGGGYVPYILDAPDFVHRSFSDLFAAGVPSLTPHLPPSVGRGPDGF